MRHALLVEGGIHHLDQLRNLSGSDPVTVAGWELNHRVAWFDRRGQGLYVDTSVCPYVRMPQGGESVKRVPILP